MKKFYLLISIAISSIMAILLVTSCSPSGIDPETIEDAKISEVVNGNTIILDNGLTVHINGIKKSSSFCEEQLQTLVGSMITLKLDSNEPVRKLSSYEDDVWAYVRLEETGEDLTEILLGGAGEDAFDKASCDDRREKYSKMFKEGDPILSSTQLCAKMKAASMLVYGGNNSSTWIGTAFFIGKDGLALTNNHVLNHQSGAVVYISDSQGNIDLQQPYNVERIVYTDEVHDYTIFYVSMDPTSLSRLSYLKLAKDEKVFVGGTQVGVLGNPAPGMSVLTMSYADGTISAIRDDGKIQINAPITHGFSGGPCANQKGHVIGISQSGYENNNANLNFTVDIRLVREKLNALNLPYAGK